MTKGEVGGKEKGRGGSSGEEGGKHVNIRVKLRGGSEVYEGAPV